MGRGWDCPQLHAVGKFPWAAMIAASHRKVHPRAIALVGMTRLVDGLELLLLIPVYRLHREGWQAHCDIFRAAFVWSGVADPFSGVGDDGLPCLYV
jgi:hypothetical protein